jgi:hypothetical protein
LYGDPIASVYKVYRGMTWILWLVLGAFVGGAIAILHRDESKFLIGVVLAAAGEFVPYTIRTALVDVV